MPTTQTTLFPPTANQKYLLTLQMLLPLRLADTSGGSYAEALPPAGLNSTTGQSNQNQELTYIKDSADANTFTITGALGGSVVLATRYAVARFKSDGTNWRPAVPPAGVGSATLAGDTDVLLTAPANGEILTYETSSTKWKNKPAPSPGSSTLAGDTDVVIAAPANLDVLTYDSASTKWKNKPAAGGIPSGSNVLQLYLFNSTDSYNNFTSFLKIPARRIVNLAASWKFSLWVAANAPFTADHTKVLRCAIDSLAVIDSTNVTWSGGACSIGLGETFCDAIALQLDTAHDYWIAIHGTGATASLKVAIGAATTPELQTTGGYAAGDQTGVTTIPGSLTAECAVSRVVSA